MTIREDFHRACIQVLCGPEESMDSDVWLERKEFAVKLANHWIDTNSNEFRLYKIAVGITTDQVLKILR